MSLLGKHTSTASSALHCFVGALFHVGHDNLIANFPHLVFSRQLLNVTVVSCYLFYHESHGLIFLKNSGAVPGTGIFSANFIIH